MICSALAWSVLLAPPPAELPVRLVDPLVTEVAFGSSMSGVFLDTSALDAAWREAGAPGFVPGQWTPFAVNGELWVGRHVPAFDFVETAQARGDRESGGVRTKLEMTFTELSYGYAVVHERGLSLVPRLGFALAESVVTVQPLRSGDVRFTEVVADPRLASRASKTSMVVDLGASLTYLISFGRRDAPGLGSGVRVGLRIGALLQLFDFGPQGNAWKSGPDRIVGAPDLRVDGAVVRLVVAPSLLHRSARKPRS